MSEFHEVSLPVPLDLVRNTTGLSMDCGGSLMKIVYRSQENRKESAQAVGTVGHLQFISASATNFEPALAYTKEHSDVGTEGRICVYTTGYRCSLHKDAISRMLSLQLCQLNEHDCLPTAFYHLISKLSRSHLLEPFQEKVASDVLQPILDKLKSNRPPDSTNPEIELIPVDFSGQTVDNSELPLSEAEDIFPCLYVCGGSAFNFYKMDKDESWSCVDATTIGGKAMYNVGKLLTDCGSFEELIELASRGNSYNVDASASHLMQGFERQGDDASRYADIDLDLEMLVTNFGRCRNQETRADFKREDLAAAWLNFFAIYLVDSIYNMTLLHGTKRVFFAGSFCNHEFVRKLITAQFAKKNVGNTIEMFHIVSGVSSNADKKKVVKFDFLKHGSYMCAIGAMVLGLEQQENTVAQPL